MYKIQYEYHKIFLKANRQLGWDRIPEGWCIHHKDRNRENNDISNLQLMTIEDHDKLHGELRTGEGHPMWGKHNSEETKQKISACKTGVSIWPDGREFSDEHKQHMSEAQTGRVNTEEHNKNISEARKGIKYSEETCRRISESKTKHITQEMIDDIKIGLTKFCKKYNVSSTIFYKIKNN